MLQAIIFDVDGTLAETEEVHRAAFNEAFKEAGLDWHWSEALYRDLLQVTGGKERIAHYIALSGGLGSTPLEVDEFISALHRRKTTLYAEMMASGLIGLRPGVAELIEGALSQDVRLAIATTTSRPNVDALLARTLGAKGLSAFAVIAAGDSVPAKKPAPDIFLAALADLGVPAPCALAIEDSANGLRSALGAGIATLVTPSRYSLGEDFTGAARVAETLAALIGETAGEGGGPQPSDLLDAVRAIHRSGTAGFLSGASLAAAE